MIQFTMRFILIFVVLTVSLVICKDIIGVDPKQAHLYKESTFKCDKNTKEIPISWINDNYCDCLDGTDEPGTSACISGKFYCKNENFHPSFIPSAWVNDGVCDCCDGSDEYNSNKCKDTCLEELKKEYYALLDEIKLYESALKIKSEWIEQSKEIRKTLHHLEDAKKYLENVKENIQQLQFGISEIKNRYEYIDSDATLHDKINFYTSKIFFEMREIFSVVIPTELSKLSNKLSDAQALKNEIEDKIRKAESIQQDVYYGLDDIYLQLIDKTYTFSEGTKTYSLQPFNKVSRLSKLLGKWNGWKSDNEMIYDQGSTCDEGKTASCYVKLVCNKNEGILSVERKDGCTTIITLGVPGACSEEELGILEKKAKSYPFK